MVIEDEKMVTSRMDGEFYLASRFAFSLRKALYMEHFGLTEPEVLDPLSPDMNLEITRQAKVSFVFF
jgi:phospholipase D1/2